MARFIDADRMKRNIVDDGAHETAARLRTWVDNQITVDAIPVEWIMKWSNKRYRETQKDVSIVDVLAAWQKEQEEQK